MKPTLLLGLTLGVCLASVASAQGHLVIINEVRIDQDSSDTDEYFELLTFPGAVSLVEEPTAGNQSYAGALGFTDVGPDWTFVPGHAFRCLTSPTDWRIGVFDPIGLSDTPGAFNTSCAATSTVFCDPAELNETGAAGEISLTGSGSIQLNDNALLAENLPSAFGVFVQADMTGSPVMSMIGGNPMVPATIAGDTVHHQFYFRDSVFSGGGNFTNGVSVTWAP